MSQDHHHQPGGGNGMISRAKWVFIGFALIAAYFLILEHKAHLSGYLQYWPFLLLLACPLLHRFMHGGHGDHGGHGRDRNDGSKGQKGE